jgi:cobalamin biosynthesis protein CbiD
MKLENILENLNSFEKNSFLKILDSIIEQSPNNQKAIEKILSEQSKDIRSIDNINVAKVFDLIANEFTSHIKSEFLKTSSQLDILIDIISRDGNAIMKLLSLRVTRRGL